MATSQPTNRPTPHHIGRFAVESLLGSGGMGDVYKAVDPVLQRTVAVKTVRPDIIGPAALDRLYREAQACGRLQHPNIVTVYEAGTADGDVFIAMEYLKGESLSQALATRQLRFETKIRILIDVLDALAYAHREGVIHRDIKPSNVHLLPDGSVKLLDFGLARVEHAETLTHTSMAMGTPYYASPEQLRGERVDARTDIYSTGVLAYEMFAGRRAFDGDSIGSVVGKVLSVPPAPIDTSWSAKFPEVEQIVFRAMSKSAADRYGAAEEMRDALGAFLAGARPNIEATAVEIAAATQRVLSDTTVLLGEGRAEEAKTLLLTALRANPDDTELRTRLFEQTGDSSLSSMSPTIIASQGRAGAPVVDSPSVIVRQRARRSWLVAAASVAVAAGIAIAVVVTWKPSLPPPGGETGTSTVERKDGGATTIPGGVTDPGLAPGGDSSADLSKPSGVGDRSPSAGGTLAANAGGGTVAPEAHTGNSGVDLPPKKKVVSAKQLFLGGDGGTAASTESASHPVGTGLKYRVIKQSASGDVEVDPTTTFHSGDRVRLAFESNLDGFLYVIAEGSTGNWNVLFPHPRINGGRNLVKSFQPYTVPSDDWFLFDSHPGKERLHVVLSKDPIPLLPGFREPVTTRASVDRKVVEEVSRGLQARDLLIESASESTSRLGAGSETATYVVDQSKEGNAVGVTIELVHGE